MAITPKAIGTRCLILEYQSQKNGHLIDFDISVVNFGCMKNITVVKTNILTVECRLYENMNKRYKK
jgi:hypothetical protein